MLTERTSELARLSESLADCERGRGRVVLIGGGLATGKTALLEALGDLVGDRATLLRAVGSRAERDLRLGVVTQLLAGAEPRVRDRITRLTDAPLDVRALEEIGELLLSGEHPLVLAVDDVHFADPASQQVLLYLHRRIASARVLLVLTEWERPNLAREALHAALARQPDQRIDLKPLSPGGVAELIEDDGDRATTAFALTGGNPLLLNALVEDGLAVGPKFRRAVLDCLTRWDPDFLAVAEASTILGDSATPALVAELLSMSPRAVGPVLDALGTAGLAREHRLRHPDVLLESLKPDESARLHARAAELLHRRGAPAVEIARHLTAAGEVPGRWAMRPLRYAAEQSLVDDAELAVGCLELALRACEDERERVELRAALIRAAWRINPSIAARHLGPLADRQDLRWREAIPVVRLRLWQGDTAAELLRTTRTHGKPHPRAAAELRIAAEWIHGGLADESPLATDETSWGRTSHLMETWAKGNPGEALRAAEHVLQSCAGDVLPEAASAAVLALDHTGQVERARHWCEVLTAQARRQGATTTRALITAVRADMSWRRGDLVAAETQAQEAMRLLHPQSWGVLVGLPLSTLILVNSALGRHDVATELLARPVPDEMAGTTFGLRHLHATGRHGLATGRTLAALDAFERVAARMRRPDPALPTTVPWRSDLAQTYLLLGRRKEARELVVEQLSGASGGLRVRAIALRVLAACSDPRQRIAVLREAIQLLERCGDRLELARSLADLSQAHSELGQLSNARLVLRKADQMAKACQAEVLPHRLRDSLDTRQQSKPAREGTPLLSDAERKVAELAARGQTNREIGRRLYITVSTVEQHLTRVYRKLNVRKRTELPAELSRLNDDEEHRSDPPRTPAPTSG
ncbi:LuxR C-terminal-related transcriptional regulator [Saccharopolyspora mangrovi]|uniref:LuxR C-terminal-related transcriptional regulator n=1 Tax=Saccharopolyspora mangrovi TaxID=3082379 RepID=A0ABU6A6U6_9PSEU|nr:AAA family ATPase [Saccharopolyspora sp. S2-29]MEB3367282.1 LuxR C-terminal-related transcriptional regulator [Saccharopolyspora sp. S2-29]